MDHSFGQCNCKSFLYSTKTFCSNFHLDQYGSFLLLYKEWTLAVYLHPFTIMLNSHIHSIGTILSLTENALQCIEINGLVHGKIKLLNGAIQ